MAIGLREAHGWSEVQINRYLAALPGVVQERSGEVMHPDAEW
jgi:hypothetical protein